MNGSKDIVIEQLRADVERLRERAEKAESRVNALEASLALERVTIAELKLEAHQLRTNLHLARIERNEARAERDARPDISAEDARIFVDWWDSDLPSTDSAVRTVNTLRSHAAKAVRP